MNFNKSNYQLAISAIEYGREDHYNGVDAIYRLAACVPIVYEETSADGLRRQIKQLTKQLSLLDVQADRLYINEDMIEIDFHPKGFQMVMTRGQYVGLLLEFADFLDKSKIENIQIQDGFYYDDPETSVRTVSNDQINFFPEFNSKCFGKHSDDVPIEVYNCCIGNKYEGVV